jgi:predicted transcriptional regulator
MHKMSTTMHKSAPTNVVTHLKKNRPTANGSIDHKSSQNAKIKENISSAASKIAVIDIEKQNRLSKAISLHSKGLNQEEIAQELHVDQSTVCRDLQYIKHESRIKIEMYLREDILFEYVRYMAGSNEITRHLWEIVQDNETTTKEKTNALSCLMQSYNSRLQTLTTGPESYMNIKKSLSEIDLQRLVESSPALKAQVNQRKLFQKSWFNFKSR